MNNSARPHGRELNQIRPITIEYDTYGYGSASVLLTQGKTKVFCAISLEPRVPHFLRGQGSGWLTAEYAMLPSATQQRTNRESSSVQRNARSSEISRIIGRCLRTSVDLTALGEKTIYVDCDVLQADGGTRVACITAASLALKEACNRWEAQSIIRKKVFKESIYAISAGVVNEKALLDLEYCEDSKADADFNFIFTEQGNILEIQGTAEKKALPWSLFEELKDLSLKGIREIIKISQLITPKAKTIHFSPAKKPLRKQKTSAFSLGSRLNQK